MTGADVHNLLRAAGRRENYPIGQTGMTGPKEEGTEQAESTCDGEGVRVPVLKNIAI